MKKLVVLAVVLFTTLTLQSCRQSDDVMSPEETATFKKVQDSSNNSVPRNNDNVDNGQNDIPASLIDGEILPPPRK